MVVAVMTARIAREPGPYAGSVTQPAARSVADQQASSVFTRLSRPLVMVAVLTLAVNLRPAVNALGAVIPELRDATGMSGGTAGLLLALPTLSFALLGIGAPALAARIGSHRTVLLAVLLLIVGQLFRSLLPGVPMLFLGSVLTLAGIAIGNVLLPGLVRLHFPGAVTAVTAVYTTLLTAGGAIGAAITLPLQDAFGGDWRLGIGMWAALAAVALVPWIAMALAVGRPSLQPAGPVRIPVSTLRRSTVAWAMAGYFGLQSLQAYVLFGWLPEILVDAGLTDQAGAFQVFVIAGVGIPIAAIVPWLLGRLRSPRGLIVAMMGCYLAGYLGLLTAPGGATLLWSLLLGLGGGAFPTALTLIAIRARTPGGTIALSAFAQSVGYLLASAGPILFGLIHDWTRGWTWPLIMLCCLLAVHLTVGLIIARPRYVEDDLPAG
jgi:CP family cyanate transporter-like MFS transporter